MFLIGSDTIFVIKEKIGSVNIKITLLLNIKIIHYFRPPSKNQKRLPLKMMNFIVI